MVLEIQEMDKESTETQLCFDLVMMVYLTGKERNEKEWKKLFLAAGFSHYKITPIMGLRSLIEVDEDLELMEISFEFKFAVEDATRVVESES
uniref:O-methyltransferase C-terminal domain-containing protein n=1 Tax=Quercus lobata TaxID=97700 RepID=A0A7N2MCH8_QUELO